jgi:hypothetical protein
MLRIDFFIFIPPPFYVSSVLPDGFYFALPHGAMDRRPEQLRIGWNFTPSSTKIACCAGISGSVSICRIAA